MQDIWQAIAQDFSDIPSPAALAQAAVRLGLAVLVGAVLGYERARSGKSAGMRTHMIVAAGAALFVLIPQSAGMELADLSRVIQGIVTGIGFIGGGTILKQSERQEIHGLTTAAGLWLTAALGMAAGMGREGTVLLGTALAFFILSVLQRFEPPARDEDEHQGAKQN
jgi:putative Mg2+ transporter-C (MgtC) family protein